MKDWATGRATGRARGAGAAKTGRGAAATGRGAGAAAAGAGSSMSMYSGSGVAMSWGLGPWVAESGSWAPAAMPTRAKASRIKNF